MSPKQFEVPAKIHFVSPDGDDIGIVYADCVVPGVDSVSFRFGTSCVATIDGDCLLIGPRKIERSALRTIEPFWWEAEGSRLSGIGALLGPSLGIMEQEAV